MNENESKVTEVTEVTETTIVEAIVTGWQHPFIGASMVNKYETITTLVGITKMTLAWAGIVAIIFVHWFYKAAENQDVQIKDASTGKWCFWDKALKKWLPKD